MPARDKLDQNIRAALMPQIIAIEADAFEGLFKDGKTIVHELLREGEARMRGPARNSQAFYYPLFFIDKYRLVLNNWPDLRLLQLTKGNVAGIANTLKDRDDLELLQRILIHEEEMMVVINNSMKRFRDGLMSLWSEKDGREPL
jgi:hypothetical protein